MSRKPPQPSVTCTCTQCGMTFQVKAWEHARGVGKFCSRACTAKGQQRRVDLPCAHCGTPFEVLEWQKRRERRRYCSTACSHAAQEVAANENARFRTQLVCQQCGATFILRRSDQKHPGSGKFCSAPCAYKGRTRSTFTTKPKPSQKPAPVTPRADDLPLVDGGSHVRCHGCQEFRLRGTFCPRCEWRAFQEVAS
jgi:endogenous inhibitor of DNA gyrase (YacG/DUF329 family)